MANLELHEVLAKLYPRQADIIRIVDDAGMDVSRVPLTDSAVNIWDAVIEYAENSAHLSGLLSLVQSEKEYGRNAEFQAAYDKYYLDKAKRVQRETGAPLNPSKQLHDRTPINTYLVEMIHKMDQKLDVAEETDRKLDAYIASQRPHRLRPTVLISAFVAIPLYTILTFEPYRGLLMLSDMGAFILALLVAYAPLMAYTFTQPGY